MAHNLEQTASGRYAMFCVGKREAAWHELGQRTNNAVTWQDAMKLAELDWTVSLQPLFFKSSTNGEVEIPSKFAVVRDSDSSPLGVVGKVYTPIQNVDAFAFVDAIIESANGAHYESAGALGKGERIWCLARIPEADFTVGANDKHETYIMFTTSHGGSEKAEAVLTDVRIVCNNTLNMALSSKKHFVKFSHTKTGVARMEAAKELIAGVVTDAKKLSEKFEKLASKKMTKQSFMTIVDKLFPVETDEKKLAAAPGLRAAITRRENVMSQIIANYEKADGGAFPEQKGTAYNFLNAITEWVDHTKNVNARGDLSAKENRATQAMFGTGAEFKKKAFETILEVMGGGTTTAKAFNIGDVVRLKSWTKDSPRQTAKVRVFYSDIKGSLILDAPLEGYHIWNASDLELVERAPKS